MSPSEMLRTPESRFERLPDYPFSPNYREIDGLRIHYVDEGPEDARPVLLMHGEPSWSYLYRKMIPPLNEAGFRTVAPDIVGFGRSDKLPRTKDYSYQMHVDMMVEFVKQLKLHEITLFCQDWGGLIGLRVLGEQPDRFARVVASNTGLPAARGLAGRIGSTVFKLRLLREGKVSMRELQEKPSFLRWVAYSRTVPSLPIGDILQFSTVTDLPPEVIQAYEAPFPDEQYKAGARIFPSLVPTQLRENQRVWDDVLSKWEKPFLTAFSDRDPITAGVDRLFQRRIPGAREREHVTIKDAGHFLQEDKGEELVQVIVNLIEEDA
ncbi:MAG: haloalkane dehalogenase [Candidatus Thorarchaeota archaeon]|nr:MAG: haloalkane dehalogenase [Candidatus Thorarchaeota archaeon]